MYLWLIVIGVAAICAGPIYSFWKTCNHRARVLARQAKEMGWVRTGTVKRDGYPVAWTKRYVRFGRGNEEAVVWHKDATVTLVRAHAPPTFGSFFELEHWLAKNPNESHDGEADGEKLYLQRIDKHITRMGYFQTLLEAQATDQIFYLECTKFWKSGYLAGESAEVVATLTLDAFMRYEKDRMGSVAFMAGVAKLWGSADSGDKLGVPAPASPPRFSD